MAGYIGSKAAVVSSGAERKKTFDITGTTTSLTGLSYTVNQVHVFHNGVRLVDGTDFTATNGNSITLTSAAESGDEVVVISYAGYQVSDTVSASQGGTFSGDVTMSGNLNTTDVLPSTDSTSDLGSTSKRFQDLYLSGGVYLGGTGSANKLDDYEEGTIEVTMSAGSGTITLGNDILHYTKIGNFVHVNGQLSTTSVSSPSGTLEINLPFTCLSGSGDSRSQGICIIDSSNTLNAGDFNIQVVEGNATAQIFRTTGAIMTQDATEIDGSSYIKISLSYKTA